MKKFVLWVMVLMMIITMTGNGYATCGSVYFDVIDGQKVLIGEPEDIVAYLSTLNRQQLLDLAIIDRGNGQFYARGLAGDKVLTWDNGKAVSAYYLAPDMDEYRMLSNGYLLVQNGKGEVVTKPFPDVFQSLDNIGYPQLVYSPADEALIEEFTLAESYTSCECFDTLSTQKGFNNQRIFMALKTWSRWSEKHQKTVYMEELDVITIGDMNMVQPPWVEPYKPGKEPDKDPEKNPDKTPENNPRPTPRPVGPENNPRPTPGVPTGEGEVSHDDPDPLPGGNTGSGSISQDLDPFKPGSGSNTGSGDVSHDTDPISGDSSSSRPSTHTGSGDVSHDMDPMSGGSSSKPSSHTGSGSISQDTDPMSGGTSSSSESSSRPSSHTSSERVSHDSDPMYGGGSRESNSSRPSESSSSGSESSSRPGSSSSSSESSSRPSSSSSEPCSSESSGSGSASHDADPFG